MRTRIRTAAPTLAPKPTLALLPAQPGGAFASGTRCNHLLIPPVDAAPAAESVGFCRD